MTEQAVARLAGDPELARIWRAVHGRLEATGGAVASVSVTLRAVTDTERRRIDLLFGTRSRARDLRVPLDRLAAVLAANTGATLEAVVTRAVGPLRDRPGERAGREAAAAEVWELWCGHEAAASPAVREWLEGVRSTGRWRRLDDPRAQMRSALDVLARLPLALRLGRSQLAASVVGDAHALDDGAPVGRLVLSALAHASGDPDAVRTAASRRALWRGVGVYLDTSASAVLTVGLRPLPRGPATEAAARWADSGTPLRVPLAALEAEVWCVASGTVVSVCENPAVVEAAATHLGAACPAVVCVEGQPSVAARSLLSGLIDGGAEMRYHGDFGAGGITIANTVIGEMSARPWRFCTEDHAMALASLDADRIGLPPLRGGSVPEASWDRDLALAIEACGVEVEEEHVLDLLVADLVREML